MGSKPSRKPPGNPSIILPVVAVALAMDELDRLQALEQPPEPALFLGRLEARRSDFNMLVGVVAAYLKAKDVDHE